MHIDGQSPSMSVPNSLHTSHAVSYLYQCNTQYSHLGRHKLVFSKKFKFMKENYVFKTLVSPASLILKVNQYQISCLLKVCKIHEFKTAQPAQNQSEYQILFHKIYSTRDLYTITLVSTLECTPRRAHVCNFYDVRPKWLL